MKTSPSLQKQLIILILLVLLPSFAACGGTLEVGIERTATPTLAAQIATSSVTPTPPPSANSDPAQGNLPPGLIYWADDQLWKVNADGQPIPMFSPSGDQALYLNWRSSARVSPDGDGVLYWDQETNDLWLADLGAGLRRNLTNTPKENECCVRWWPGRPDTVVFSSQSRELAPSPSVGTGSLGVVGVDGGGYRILDDQNDTHGIAAPSPDGQTIAYGAGRTAWLYHWEMGPEVFDPADYGLAGSESVEIGSPAWSPAGTQLAWVVDGGDPSRDGRIGIGVFDLEQRTARLLHPYDPLGMDGWPPRPLWSEGWPSAPLWSPDGRWLAFVALAQNPVEASLWVVRADGQGAEEIPLAIGRNDSLVWSPDGRWLIFTLTTETLASSMWMVEVGTWSRYQVDLPPGAVVVDWLAASPPAPIQTPAPPISATTEPMPIGPTITLTPVPAPTDTPLPAFILAFDVTPAEIAPGEPVTLTWRAALHYHRGTAL